MSYLLDTCAISESAAPQPNDGFSSWLEAQPEEALYLSVLTVGELTRGVRLLPTGRKRASLERWLAELRSSFIDRLLPVDEAIAAIWGDMSAQMKRAGKALHPVDGVLAATALHHGYILVTRNARDFRVPGLTVINPWS